MEDSMIRDRIICEKKAFMCRLFSSFLFILIAVMLFWVPVGVFSFLCWATFAFLAYEIFSVKTQEKILLQVIALVFCFLGIRSFLYCREALGQLGCIFLICISAFTDTGAYVFGKILLGPKLCPKISPQKTWAGFWGGILLADTFFFALKGVFFKFSPGGCLADDNWKIFLTVQAVILACIAGDLSESGFKRALGVKDMGDLFPGHGGLLDRLDSLLAASIILALINMFFYGGMA
ncbi:MAG: phosphatidate cytidylyltransferase [Holosporaceae bacterium]|jgi:phosphatidate cytidylyltransferase|nr:phosphatidate cytidylyltransferase [Holosporaceae bacterium]